MRGTETQSHFKPETLRPNRMTPPPADLLSAPTVGQATRLCHCLKLSYGEVADAIEFHACESVEQVTNACGAGGGCTACHRRIRALLNSR